MKKMVQILSGLNGSSLIRGLRLGPGEFLRACQASHEAAHPLISRESANHQTIVEALNTIPEVSLGDLLDSTLGKQRATFNLELTRYEDGRLPIRDAVPLLSILVAEHPAEVLEIGTYMGHTTKAMAQNLPGALIHTVDLPLDFDQQADVPVGDIAKDDFHLIKGRVVGREFAGTELAGRIRQHFGDTAKIDFHQFGQPTFFFIDGSHTYDYCRQDSEKYLALCQGKGVFLWHDCDEGHPGVIKFILEWRAAGRNLCRIAGTSLAYWKA